MARGKKSKRSEYKADIEEVRRSAKDECFTCRAFNKKYGCLLEWGMHKTPTAGKKCICHDPLGEKYGKQANSSK